MAKLVSVGDRPNCVLAVPSGVTSSRCEPKCWPHDPAERAAPFAVQTLTGASGAQRDKAEDEGELSEDAMRGNLPLMLPRGTESPLPPSCWLDALVRGTTSPAFGLLGRGMGSGDHDIAEDEFFPPERGEEVERERTSAPPSGTTVRKGAGEGTLGLKEPL